VTEYFNKKHEKATIKLENARNAQARALEKLYQTKNGQFYKQKRDEWSKCISENERTNAEQTVKKALKKLKATEEYKDFYPFLKEVAYWENLERGLDKIASTSAATWIGLKENEEKNEEMVRIIIANNMGRLAKADKTNILWAENVRDDELRAEYKLLSLVRFAEEKVKKEIKANEKRIKKTEAVMPEYQ
jgi:hypothetical protein